MRSTFWTSMVFTVLAGCCLSSGIANAAEPGWIVDFKKAKEMAAEKKLDVLMEFTGSDWCPPCKRLKAAVFDKDIFKETAPKSFVLLKLDNPSDKSKQSKEEIAQYKTLSKQFGVTGVPTIFLADAKGRPYAKIVGYGGQTAEQYLKTLTAKVKVREERDEKLAKAEKAKGVEKAKLMAEAVKGIDAELVISTYRDLVDEIIKLDADNEAKLKEKFEGLLKLTDVKKTLASLLRKARTDPKEGIKAVDDLIKKEKLKGVSLQEALYAKGALLFRSDKPAAQKALQEALRAAPDSAKAKQIQMILERAFKNTDS